MFISPLFFSLQYIDFQYRIRWYFELVKGWEKKRGGLFLIYDTIVFLLALELN